MINIVTNVEIPELITEDLMIRAAQVVLEQEERADSDMSVVIDNDEKLRELNHSYLGIDSPTDVLSFAADELDPDTGNIYLGDVIISIQRATDQADASNETLLDEIQLLIVHGTLHLIGYDHSDSPEKKKMWDAQQNALDVLGCKITHLPE